MLLQKILDQRRFAHPPPAGNHGQIPARAGKMRNLAQARKLFLASVEFHGNRTIRYDTNWYDKYTHFVRKFQDNFWCVGNAKFRADNQAS
jgi:hypothetical protein